MPNTRPDHVGPYRGEFYKNKKKILQTQDTCAICGRPVDKNIKYPDPWSPTIDHIVPISKNGHPSDITNLQLAHRFCNRMKADKDMSVGAPQKQKLLQSVDWSRF